MEKVYKEILRDFTKFLKKEQAYIKYKEAVTNDYIRMHSYASKQEKIRKMQTVFLNPIYVKIQRNGLHELNDEICFNLINYAFTWYNTREGHDFWCKLNDKWKDFFMEKKLGIK